MNAPVGLRRLRAGCRPVVPAGVAAGPEADRAGRHRWVKTFRRPVGVKGFFVSELQAR